MKILEEYKEQSEQLHTTLSIVMQKQTDYELQLFITPARNSNTADIKNINVT